MPPRQPSDARVDVIELGACHAYLSAVHAVPEPERIELLIRQTAGLWLESKPGASIDRLEFVRHDGQTVGAHLWYSVVEKPASPQQPSPVERLETIKIEVDPQVAKRYTHEYLEAVIVETRELWLAQHVADDSLLYINPRGLAIILDTCRGRGQIVEAASLLRYLAASTVQQMTRWLSAPDSRAFVIHIPGSWFALLEPEKCDSRIALPSLRSTNMTYDKGDRLIR